MQDGSGLTFPTSDVLAGWWRQLAPLQPRALWAGHLFWQRVEALVQTSAAAPLERGTKLYLQAFALGANHAALDPVQRLRERVHLPEAMVRQALHALRQDGLVTRDLTGLTELGKAALSNGTLVRPHWQRRQFAFVERLDESCQRVSLPQHLALGATPAASWPTAPPWDDQALRHCLGQSAAWKQACGFPLDVQALADGAPQGVPVWQRVTVVRPERTLTALVSVGPEGGERWLGCAARGDTGGLTSTSPFFTLSVETRALVPELAPEPRAGDLSRAWQAWCAGHGVTTPAVAACACQLDGMTLKVQAPMLLHHELRAKLDGLEAPPWLLLGSGPVRRAAQVHLRLA